MREKKINQPFFSIVLPIYNVEKYLNRCINSILEQDFDDYEVILVEDGSKDNCYQLCEEWGKKDFRIRVIHKKNAGLGMARNTGLENAKGKYVFFIDSDDYILPGLFSDVYNKLQKNYSEVIFYGFKRIDETGKETQSIIPNPNKLFFTDHKEIKNKLFQEFLSEDPKTGVSQHLRISAWNCCISVNFLKDHKLFFVSEREYISEDIYFYIEMFSQLSKIEFIPKAYYCYCQNVGSLTFTYKEDRYIRIKDFYIKVQELLKNRNFNERTCLRMNACFISSVLGCLKMEAANINKVGFFKTYKKVKHIVTDSFFKKSIEAYRKSYPKNWRYYYFCFDNELIVLLIVMLYIQYCRKGI